MDTEKTQIEQKVYSKPKGVSYPNRLLKALDEVLFDPKATNDERLQAANLMIQSLPLRKTPRRKSDKEKLVEQALSGKKPTPQVFKGNLNRKK